MSALSTNKQESLAIQHNHNQSMINVLARNNDVIKSIFHFKKPITFLVVALAIQKVRNISYKDHRVFITKSEIKNIATGKDSKKGVNILVQEIRADLEKNNFFNLHDGTKGLKDNRVSLIAETAITDDLFEDLYIDFRKDLFKRFKTQNNYTKQAIEQLRICGNDNPRVVLYTLCQQHASLEQQKRKLGNTKKTPLVIEVNLLKEYWKVPKNKYSQICNFTLQVKRVCEKITKENDINLFFDTLKSGNKVNAYAFYPTFKLRTLVNISQDKGNNSKLTGLNNAIQQMLDWNIAEDLIESWLLNYCTSDIIDSINETITKAKTNPKKYLEKIFSEEDPKYNSYNKVFDEKQATEFLDKLGFNSNERAIIKKTLGDEYFKMVIGIWNKNVFKRSCNSSFDYVANIKKTIVEKIRNKDKGFCCEH